MTSSVRQVPNVRLKTTKLPNLKLRYFFKAAYFHVQHKWFSLPSFAKSTLWC